MKKQLLVVSIISVIVFIVLQVNRLLNVDFVGGYQSQITTYVYIFIFAVLIGAIVGAFKKIFAPLIIMAAGIGVVVLVTNLFTVELNYYAHQEEREEMIEKLVSGEIKKEESGNPGFAFYYTPQEYLKANKTDYINARIYSDEKHVVFFQSAESRFLDFIGLTEGFVYSATGELPSGREMGFLEYRKINDQWYFVSSDEKRFRNLCPLLCSEEIIEAP